MTSVQNARQLIAERAKKFQQQTHKRQIKPIVNGTNLHLDVLSNHHATQQSSSGQSSQQSTNPSSEQSSQQTSLNGSVFLFQSSQLSSLNGSAFQSVNPPNEQLKRPPPSLEEPHSKKQKLDDTSSNHQLNNQTHSSSTGQSNGLTNDVDPLEAFMRDLQQSNRQSVSQPMDESSDSQSSNNQQIAQSIHSERFYNDDECAIDEEDLDQIGQKIFDNDAINQSIKHTKKLKKKEIHPLDQSATESINLLPIKKNFWRESPDISALTDDQISDIRSLGDQTNESLSHIINPTQSLKQSINQSIKIRGDQCPRPFTDWSQCGLPLRIQDLVLARGFAQPFSIQRQAIPVLMSGRDLIAIASTGSGKTLAYVLSLVRHISVQRELQSSYQAINQSNNQSVSVEDDQSNGPVGLVLAPTRELASQIFDEVRMFASALDLSAVNVSGGSSVNQSINQIKRGVDIVVATPGRLIDILSLNKGRILSLVNVSMLILDEADRMFDSGFEPQIQKILSLIRSDRQIAMFSATFPLAIEKFARKMLRQANNQAKDQANTQSNDQSINNQSNQPLGPIELIVGGRSTVSANINQSIEVRSEDSKFARLLELLGHWSTAGSIIIFVERQSTVDTLYQSVTESANYPVITLHANMDQDDRESSLTDFKVGFSMDQMLSNRSANPQINQPSTQLAVVQQPNILITTSVLARGLDVPHCVLVVNYDAPNHYEDYVHRVGRTGRAGRRGCAITFVRPDQVLQAQMLAKALTLSNQPIPSDLQALIDASNLTKPAGNQSVKRLDGFHRSRGYRFDETEEAEHREAERLRRMGDNPDADPQELAQMKDEMEALKKVSNKPSSSPSNNQTNNTQSTSLPLPPRPPPPPVDPLAAQKAAIKAAALAASLSKIGSGTDEQATQAAQNAREKSEKAAHEIAAERARALAQSLAARAAAAHASTQAANASTRVKLTLTINDYPQAARWAVTKKGSLDDVLENTGCNVISKGVFVAPGGVLKPGQEKLFLMIEGDNEQEASKVRNEIQRRLELVSAEQGQRESNMQHNTQGRIQGRYEVMRIKDR